MPHPDRLCVAGPRMGLDTETVLGFYPCLVKVVISMETSALPVPDKLG